MEERRLLVAVALSFVALTAFRLLYPSPPAPAPGAARPAEVASAQPAAPAGQAPAAAPLARPTPQASPTPAPVEPTVVGEREERVEVSGPAVEVAFNTRGARLLSWRLRQYLDRRGRPEEMVPASGAGAAPLDLETGDVAIDERLRQALFVASVPTLALSGGQGHIRFYFASEGLSAEKDLRFERDGYLVTVRTSVRRKGQEVPHRVIWGPGLGNPTAEEREVQGYHPPQGVALSGAGVERFEAAKQLASPRALSGPRWAGVESQYFAALWLPGGGSVTLAKADIPARGEEAAQQLPVAAAQAATGQDLELFVGPKDHGRLKGLGRELEHVVPVGDWIGPLVVPLISLVRWVHGYTGNYGWAIVLLTVLINLALAPMRHYSIANGLRMAQIAPEMRAIQERYRKLPMLDPKRQEMNEEIAQLYARHGMSMGTQMMVGCLPLLLTMPFLFAFYRVLSVSIDLRGAPFLWIPDLSHRDPLYLTPILMGVSMLIMQKMMPSNMDPAQQRIMLMMPLIFTVMLFAAPAGLNLYWFASNLCSIVQQGVTMRLVKARPAVTVVEKGRKR